MKVYILVEIDSSGETSIYGDAYKTLKAAKKELIRAKRETNNAVNVHEIILK